ncbi:MAG: HlyD family efflux transporter periplasmic adaptor subunit [Aliishimia sp.]
MGTFLLLFIVAFGVWAASFQLDQTINATGQVIAQSRTQVIQVADGGVLQELRVQEGNTVKADQLLAKLETERVRAGVNEVVAKIASLQVAKIRALAEAERTSPDFSRFVEKSANSVAAQQALFDENLAGLENDLAAAMQGLEIVQDELRTLSALVENGDASQMDLMAKRRQVIEQKQKISKSQSKYTVDARREIAKIEDEISALQFQLQEKQSLLDHTNIRAPVDGVVTSLSMNTLGGVLRAGDELMRIAPNDGDKLIDVRIAPVDIGALRAGLPTMIRLDAFDYTIYGSLDGTLDYISADTLSERAEDGRMQTFYRAHVRISTSQMNKRIDVNQALKPGSTASVDFQVGRRSVLSFIAKPILRAFSGAMTQK